MNKMDVIITFKISKIQYMLGFCHASPYIEVYPQVERLKELEKIYMLIISERYHKSKMRKENEKNSRKEI